MKKKNSLGFIAFWKATDTWFQENNEEKESFKKELEKIFEEAKEKGVKMHGVYDCCWSTKWSYFTFWECPNIEVLEETMNKLRAIGDINKYNEQHHYIGRKIPQDLVQ